MSSELTHIAQVVGRIEGKLDELSGPSGRIKQLEDAHTRQWWFAVGVAPALAIFHAITRKFGIDV